MIVDNLIVFENKHQGIKSVPADTCTSDEQLKLKARSINLIKYNPNLFTNREKGNFYFMIGGEKTLFTTLGCGMIALFYRRTANVLRQVPAREAVWYNTFYFLYGLSLGAVYSAIFFSRWQVFFNDYFAHFLIKRFKGSGDLNRHNIYRLKDVENTDECYVFSTSYANSFHM